MAREQHFCRQVSFKASVIETINGYMNKTKNNFSATLNIMIEQWDDYSIFMQKYKKDQETKQQLEQFDEVRKVAKVIKK